MALKTVTSLLCDRCGNTIQEIEDASAGERSTPAYLALEVQDADGTIVQFDDVCQKCQDRIKVLVGQIRLDKAKSAGANGATDEPPTPPVEEPEETADATA